MTKQQIQALATSNLEQFAQAITGGDERSRQLAPQIRQSIATALSMDLIVSFLRESGVKSILKELKEAVNRGAKIRLLSGTYLNITEPSALRLLYSEFKDAPNGAFEFHVYQDMARSFHAKAYMFHHADRNEIFIGSSNLSQSALTSGIEWNYRFSNIQDDRSFKDFAESFDNLFLEHSENVTDEFIKKYHDNWHRPVFLRDYVDDSPITTHIIEPRGAQIEALAALEATREEGSTKALITAATGIGKTYLAAFDSKNFNKILFVAHREEILKQARTSFMLVRGTPKEQTGFFTGNRKDTTQDLIFASVQTLGQKDKLTPKYFAPNYFDYIVIDEFHHAAAQSYKRILSYFKPKFLLGLTATPERLDGKSIYALTDHNVPFSIDLFTAINHGLLVPFHYYAVYDYTVDYSVIDIRNGHYVETELEKSLSVIKRHELVFKYYSKYLSHKALGFCVSCKHAADSAAYFCEQGIKAAAVISNTSGLDDYRSSQKAAIMDRGTAISKLRAGELQIIFSVDMFNEGIDIPEIDMVLLLRPTESPIIFFQQLGRGLRLDSKHHKNFLNVIDFIGNYKRAGQAFALLGRPLHGNRHGPHPTRDNSYPDNCVVDADIKVIDLIIEQERKNKLKVDSLRLEYLRIKDELNDSIQEPASLSRLDYVQNLDDDLFDYFSGKSRCWPPAAWLEYRSKIICDLAPNELELLTLPSIKLLEQIENEKLTRSYKLPVLMSFIKYDAKGTPIGLKASVPLNDIVASFRAFYANSFYQQDLGDKRIITKCRHYESTTDSDFKALVLNKPVHFLTTNTTNKESLFFLDSQNNTLRIREYLSPFLDNSLLAREFADICQAAIYTYFRRRYTRIKEN